MKIRWILLICLAGTLMPVQAAVNARLRTFVLNPNYSALISFAVGTAAIAVVALVSRHLLGEAGNLAGVVQAPWWTLIGGFFGVLAVSVSLIAIPRVGATVTSMAIVSGQLIAAILIDHFGLLGVSLRPISVERLVGAGLLIAALWLINRQ